MKKIRCYIVDDEPLAIRVIEQYLSKLSQFEVCGASTRPVEAFEQIKVLAPDLLFADIEMPEITGMELMASLQHKPEVIFTTAYREYAVEGFELNALDYLVKPIPFPRFLKAVEKFLEKRAPGPTTPDGSDASIFVKSDRKSVRIPLDDILYAEGIKDYTRIVLSGRKILTKVSIGNFLETLPADRFVRVHKSFIVALNKITAYTALDAEIGGFEIPLGRQYRDAFLERMQAERNK